MKDEIKEIIEYIQKYTDEYETTNLTEIRALQIGYVDTVLLLDYITNLQEELDISQTNEETYRLEMLDITKILGLDEHTTFDEVKEYATNLQEENKYSDYCNKKLREKITNLEYKITTLEDYKTRNKKAVELLQNLLPLCIMPNNTLIHATEKAKVIEKAINTLQGSDNSE